MLSTLKYPENKEIWFDLYQNNKWVRYYIPEATTISRGAFAQGTYLKNMQIVSSGEDPLVIAPPELEQYLSPTLDAQSNNSEISELSAPLAWVMTHRRYLPM